MMHALCTKKYDSFERLPLKRLQVFTFTKVSDNPLVTACTVNDSHQCVELTNCDDPHPMTKVRLV